MVAGLAEKGLVPWKCGEAERGSILVSLSGYGIEAPLSP
jgi:hypothetical protein